MKDKSSRLVELIGTFNKSEWKGFCEFVRYKLKSNGGIENDLLKILDRYYPDFSQHDLDRPALLQKLKNPTLTDDKLRWAMTSIHKLASVYLKSIEADKPSGDFLLLNQYTQRGLERHHLSLSSKMEQRSKNVPRDLNWYFLDHRLSFEVDQFEERKTARRQNTGLQGVSDKLDTYFLLSKLKQTCAMLSYQRVSNQEYDIKLLQPVLQFLAGQPAKEPLLILYHCCTLMMIHEDNREHYERLRHLLATETKHIDDDEIRDLHVLARNQCIRAINLGDRSYERDLFNLYQLGLEQGVVQAIPAQFAPSFKNIVSVSLKLKEYDWAEHFIQEFAPMLGRSFQSDYLKYNLALLNFARGRFDECRNYLHGERFADLYIRLNVRTLLIKTYYELEQIDNLDSQLQSFKQFLHRNKQLSYHRKNCENLIKFVRILCNLSPGDKPTGDRLRKKITEAAHLSERNWLVQKLDAKK